APPAGHHDEHAQLGQRHLAVEPRHRLGAQPHQHPRRGEHRLHVPVNGRAHPRSVPAGAARAHPGRHRSPRRRGAPAGARPAPSWPGGPATGRRPRPAAAGRRARALPTV
ncbi:MAG: hypothetical protein AVDCRST_MAG66-4662, partial [uncultured Pseudonocardia sp.]